MAGVGFLVTKEPADRFLSAKKPAAWFLSDFKASTHQMEICQIIFLELLIKVEPRLAYTPEIWTSTVMRTRMLPNIFCVHKTTPEIRTPI